MTGLLIYPLLCAAAYYLGARAEITQPIWGRYPKRLDSFMTCAACTGFWYGAALSFLELDFLALAPGDLKTKAIIAFCAVVWTPIVSYWHLVALETLGGPEEDGGRQDRP